MSQDPSKTERTYHNEAGDIVPKEEADYSFYISDNGTFVFNFNDEIPEPRRRETPKIEWSTLRIEPSMEVRERYSEHRERYQDAFSPKKSWDDLMKDVILDCDNVLSIDPELQKVLYVPIEEESEEDFTIGQYVFGEGVVLNSKMLESDKMLGSFYKFQNMLPEAMQDEITYEDFLHLLRIENIPHEIFHERQYKYMTGYTVDSLDDSYLERSIERSAKAFSIKFLTEKMQQLRNFAENGLKLSNSEQMLLKYGENFKIFIITGLTLRNAEAIRARRAREAGVETMQRMTTDEMLDYYKDREYQPMAIPPNTQVNRIKFETDIASRIYELNFIEEIISENLKRDLDENEKKAIFSLIENSRKKSGAIATVVNEYRLNSNQRMSRKTEKDDYQKFLTPIEQLQKRYIEIEEQLKAA